MPDYAEHSEWLNAHDGLRLFYRCWQPRDPKYTMVFVHGLGEHSGRYAFPVHFFCSRGFAIHMVDNRGHGRSEGRRGHVRSFDEYAADVDLLVDHVRSSGAADPITLVGHSLGGVIALYYALESAAELGGLILSAAGLRPAVKPPAVKTFMGKVLSAVWPTLALGNELDVRHISRDPAVVDAYISDPLVHNRVTTRFYTSYLAAREKIWLRAATIRLRTLLLRAGSDRIIDPEVTTELFNALPEGNKTLKNYESSFHELFNDPDRDQVFADMLAWIES